ncbi:MAG: hypothetical protein WAW37_05065 [Syntrophobacteraceae bacterium]
MRGFFVLFICLSILPASYCPSFAASEQATRLRTDNALSEFAPPDSFLNGNFVADEIDPVFVFGKVKDFVKSRSCSTAWLIEDGERKRIDAADRKASPVEYSLYLEEDCPGKVAYYVFVDRSQANTVQWLEWRKQFHKSKAEPQFNAAKTGLDQASLKGFAVDAELRFVVVGDNLELKKPEEILTGDLKCKPVYNIKEGKALDR